MQLGENGCVVGSIETHRLEGEEEMSELEHLIVAKPIEHFLVVRGACLAKTLGELHPGW